MIFIIFPKLKKSYFLEKIMTKDFDLIKKIEQKIKRKCHQIGHKSPMFGRCVYSVDRQGFVERFRLSDFDIIELPEELFEFKHLKVLDLSELYNLQRLSIPDNFLSLKSLSLSLLPNSIDFIEIGKLKNLTKLEVAFQDCSQFSFLPELKNIKVIVVGRNVEGFDFSALPKFKYLRKLSIWNLQKSDALFVRKCKKIRDLKLDFPKTNLTSLLLKHKKLRKLSVSNGNFKLKVLQKMKNLKSLELFYMKSKDLSFIHHKSKLKKLTVNSADLTDISGLKKAKHLRYLDLSFNKNLREIDSLAKIKKLNFLELRDCNVKNADVLSNLVDLKYLNLRANPLKDVSFLNSLNKLRVIFFKYCKISLTVVNTDIEKLAWLSQQTSCYFSLVKLKGLFVKPSRKFYNVKSKQYNHLFNSSSFAVFDNARSLIGLKLYNPDIRYYPLIMNDLRKIKYLSVQEAGTDNLPYYLQPQLVWLEVKNDIFFDIEALKKMKQLRHLSIVNSMLQDLSFLPYLKNLRVLDLRKNKLSDIGYVSELPELRALLLGNANVDLSVLAECKKLRILFYSNKVYYGEKQIKEFINKSSIEADDEILMVKLANKMKLIPQRVNIIKEYNFTAGIESNTYIRYYMENKKVTALALNNYYHSIYYKNTKWGRTQAISIEYLDNYLPNEIFELKNVRYLYLINNLMKKVPEAIQKMKNLEYLNLMDNNISDISKLAYMPNLKKLILAENPVDYTKTFPFLPELERLVVVKQVVVVQSFKHLNNLKDLDLTSCTLIGEDFSDWDLEALTLAFAKNIDISKMQLPKTLRKLNLSYLNIEQIDFLADLPRLEELRLIGNNITNIEVLKKLKHLKFLDIGYNKIKDFRPIKRFLKKKDFHVYFSDNQIDSSIINEFMLAKYLSNDCALHNVLITYGLTEEFEQIKNDFRELFFTGKKLTRALFFDMLVKYEHFELLVVSAAKNYYNSKSIRKFIPEKKSYKSVFRKNLNNYFSCLCCKHYDIEKGVCPAFPQHIPYSIKTGIVRHKILFDNQATKLIYRKRK